MEVRLEDCLTPYQNLRRRHWGLVVIVVDPENRGRIKCLVQGILETATWDNLPWAYPRESTSRGGRCDSCETAVPPLFSMVQIEFPYDDIYMPIWSGMSRTDLTNPPIGMSNPTPEDPGLTYFFAASPPSSSWDIEVDVWVKTISQNVAWFRIDKNLGSWEYYDQDSNSSIRWDRGGNVSMQIQSLLINCVENFRVEVGQDLFFDVQGNTYINTVNDTMIENVGNIGLEAGGNIDSFASGFYGITTGTGDVVVISAANFYVSTVADIDMVALGSGYLTATLNVTFNALLEASMQAGVIVALDAPIIAIGGGLSLPPSTAVIAPLGTVQTLMTKLAAALVIMQERLTAWAVVIASLLGEAAATQAAGQAALTTIETWAGTLVGNANL